MEILKAENIYKSFGENKVLKGASLTLNKGEIVSLLGVSGGGKTTLFNVLSGISKPDSGRVLLNGQPAADYTFRMNYYWMMGDNRHNSADSRYWGFVPEDHVVGKPIFIWLSLDNDRGWLDGKIRWNRLFTFVDNIK